MTARLKPLTPEFSAVHRFGALLRQLRIEARYSQPELSSKLYTSKSTLSRAETGVRLLARDLAEACDELLGANGTLLAAWLTANSAPPADSPGERTRRRSTAWHCMPNLCSLALRARSTQLRGLSCRSSVPPNGWGTQDRPAGARTAQSWRAPERPLSPGRAELGSYPLPPVGFALPASPPADVSLRVVARSRPGARGTPPRGSAGGGFPKSSYPLGRVAVALARVAAGRV
jgi:transcriptional regulator with XRE-family HTH domain